MNSNKTSWPFFLVLLLTLVGVAYFGYESYSAQYDYYHLKTETTEILTWEDRLLNVNAYIFEDSQYGVMRYVSEDAVQELEALQDEANQNGIYTLIAGLSGLLLLTLLYVFKKATARWMGVSILGVSVVLLVYGIICPMIEMEAYKDDFEVDIKLQEVGDRIKGVNALANVAYNSLGLDDVFNDRTHVFEGRMYFFYQSKSIYDLITLLWKQNNYFVAIAIGLFSVVVPLIKIVLSLCFLLFERFKSYPRLKSFIGFIGKWSMADVMVVATYLGYISFYNLNLGITTDSNVLVGIYFFSAYVILSIISYFLVSKHLKPTNNGKVHTP